MSLPGLQDGTKQGEIISLPAGEIPKRWHQRSESLSVTQCDTWHSVTWAAWHQPLSLGGNWSELSVGLGIQEIAWTWKSVKTWQMGPGSEWEARGARWSQRERQGNGESFHKHRNIDMNLGQWEEVQSHWQYTSEMSLCVWSLDWLGTNDVDIHVTCDIISVSSAGWHVVTSDNHTQPLPTPGMIGANGGAQSMREPVFNGHGKYSVAITDTTYPAQISTPVHALWYGLLYNQGIDGLN